MRICLRYSSIVLVLAAASSSWAAACRVTDFTDKPLSSLNELQRLSFASRMTETEFKRIRESKQGEDNYYPLIAESDSFMDARRTAWQELENLGILNFDEFRMIWASDFLTAEQLENFTDCISSREPGLIIAGKPEGESDFRITFSHITPIGIEQIRTRLEASHNVANIDEFEQFLEDIGPQDNYTAKSFVLKRSDPAKRAVLLIRAGWETPDLIYIPAYPASRYLGQ